LLDNENRLWFTNQATHPLKYLLPDIENGGVGTIVTVPYESIRGGGVFASSLITDKDNPNLKFLTWMGGGGYFFAFDSKGTDDIYDDTFLRRNTVNDQEGNSYLYRYIYCAAQDRKTGTIWYGAEGPVLLPNPNNFFNNNYTIQKIKIPRNDGSGLADYLLDDVSIFSILVDNDNRKWLATAQSGVYLMSEDGTQEILHFTSENSPLLSDRVLSIAIDKDGEVFFGTEKGIISYQSNSTPPPPPPLDKDELHIFPNPVRENYHGPIAIKGLLENTVVKITDISGNLVYETISRGGMVTWDGNRKGGQRVSTGVYLVIMTTKDGKNHAVRKLLVIN
jgi:hypothetical protein